MPRMSPDGLGGMVGRQGADLEAHQWRSTNPARRTRITNAPAGDDPPEAVYPSGFEVAITGPTASDTFTGVGSMALDFTGYDPAGVAGPVLTIMHVSIGFGSFIDPDGAPASALITLDAVGSYDVELHVPANSVGSQTAAVPVPVVRMTGETVDVDVAPAGLANVTGGSALVQVYASPTLHGWGQPGTYPYEP